MTQIFKTMELGLWGAYPNLNEPIHYYTITLLLVEPSFFFICVESIFIVTCLHILQSNSWEQGEERENIGTSLNIKIYKYLIVSWAAP